MNIPTRDEIMKAMKYAHAVEIGLMAILTKTGDEEDDLICKSDSIGKLISLAEAYLACDEPGEQTVYSDTYRRGIDVPEISKEYLLGYNQALADYRLWLMKKCEGIEKIIKSCQINIGHHRYIDIIRKQMRDSCNVDVKDLTQAIQSHLLGEKGE